MDDQLPVPVTVTEIHTETPSVRTFSFDRSFSFEPGQFVMVWIPGIDEIPMALSSANSITVQKAGDATGAMFEIEAGASLGIRGPFGNGFTRGEKMLAIAGGVGAAPLLPLARSDCVMTMLLGARTEKELLFVDQLDESTDVIIATDDGSLGQHGFVTDLMKDIGLAAYDRIAVCGPEPMMRAVFSLVDGQGLAAKAEFSLHRYMKCGVGICGSCCIDPDGLRVCRDGPVFSGEFLKKSEFGHYCRDASGRKKNI
ncbi:dihydroorotate dehydrogenase electron transfer subunit [Methanoregula sp.]|uniref:dihydroorotate dehydrogenase electron transfer subunit n=1 Tax=Methanoregula sp. TaxID=2052170 RepID=UPI002C92CF5A|nr:dihydroorotate dehydrogenase electron transfer subunit [Methanoregula sp.]HVP97328.1 dihydroorotate dehydrogenase electron transfer subunit [Methanoregula sp.]